MGIGYIDSLPNENVSMHERDANPAPIRVAVLNVELMLPVWAMCVLQKLLKGQKATRIRLLTCMQSQNPKIDFDDSFTTHDSNFKNYY